MNDIFDNANNPVRDLQEQIADQQKTNHRCPVSKPKEDTYYDHIKKNGPVTVWPGLNTFEERLQFCLDKNRLSIYSVEKDYRSRYGKQIRIHSYFSIGGKRPSLPGKDVASRLETCIKCPAGYLTMVARDENTAKDHAFKPVKTVDGVIPVWPSVNEMPFIGDRIDYGCSVKGCSRFKASKDIFPDHIHKLMDIAKGKYANLPIEDRVAIERYFDMPVNWLLGCTMKKAKPVEKVEEEPEMVSAIENKIDSDIPAIEPEPISKMYIEEMKFNFSGSIKELCAALSALGSTKYDISISIKRKGV